MSKLVDISADTPLNVLYCNLIVPTVPTGTEANNELCAYIPGPACDADSGNLEDGPGEGYIHINRGVHGVGDLTASVHDWRNPVAEVFVARL